MPKIAADELSKRLGDEMRSWRKRAHITQEEAAHRMGVDRVQWQKWERSAPDGRNPTLESLLGIALVMDLSLPQLMQIIWSPEDEVRGGTR